MLNHSIKILLVEDNPGDALLLQENLADISFLELTWVHVDRIEAALDRLRTEDFDVILLDLGLPDGEGLDTFVQIHQQVPFTPIVVLTGLADETLALRAMQAGAQDYLVKGSVTRSDLLIRSIRYAIERKRIEATLNQREQEFRTLAENAPDIISRYDQNLRHLYVNSTVEKATGLQAQDFLGKTLGEMEMPAAHVKQWEDALRRVLNTGGQVTIEFEFHTPGEVRYYQSRFVPEFAPEGTVSSVLGITRDLTEQKQLELQLLRAQRMESLGTLASGIAHDMNNILTPILASAQLLPMLNPTLDPKSQQLLKIFVDNARRGAELVKQILIFARGLDGDRAPVQVKQILLELEQLVKNTFPRSIQILHDFPQPELFLVSADATQLHQVFMNLLVNARDAMPKGGTLTVSAENRVIDDTYVRMNLETKAGSYVLVKVTDTGIGIPPEQMDRIFEPFFTTKPLGEGTGLGLSTAIGIIKNHGGFIRVLSEVGKGTQFQVFLPALEMTPSASEKISELPSGKGELILVVDDEANIRETVKLMLEAHDYQVITANDGIEAIAAYATHKKDIKVVLVDMMMPTMGGDMAIQTLQQFNSQVKIIACSGVISRDNLLKTAGVRAFLPKPFTAEDLLDLLQRVLREA
jgi:two-component system, cell cycle sensor histidine kinase and response regulator CckA